MTAANDKYICTRREYTRQKKEKEISHNNEASNKNLCWMSAKFANTLKWWRKKKRNRKLHSVQLKCLLHTSLNKHRGWHECWMHAQARPESQWTLLYAPYCVTIQCKVKFLALLFVWYVFNCTHCERMTTTMILSTPYGHFKFFFFCVYVYFSRSEFSNSIATKTVYGGSMKQTNSILKNGITFKRFMQYLKFPALKIQCMRCSFKLMDNSIKICRTQLEKFILKSPHDIFFMEIQANWNYSPSGMQMPCANCSVRFNRCSDFAVLCSATTKKRYIISILSYLNYYRRVPINLNAFNWMTVMFIY